MILRAKTDNLIKTRQISQLRQENTNLNLNEISDGAVVLKSYPQRIVLEMTNVCNLNCVMCGRFSAEFKPTYFDINKLSLFDDVAKHIEEVTLMGWGEPSMNPDFVEFLKWANNHGLRKYFCTNGMKLHELIPHIFEQKVDVIAVSVDAATAADNAVIRRGSDLDKIVDSLKSIVAEKKRLGTQWPYMNFVTVLMKRNLHHFPKIVELAAEIGLEEVKGVFLTAFNEDMAKDSLFDLMDEVKIVFDEAIKIGEKTGVNIKIPHLRGEDPAGDDFHKPCHAAWRDIFVGSDGYFRPCMSTPVKFFNFDKYKTFDEIWNSSEYVDFRKRVNDGACMSNSCKRCYQSSFANWNKQSAFFQIGSDFSPDWSDN